MNNISSSSIAAATIAKMQKKPSRGRPKKSTQETWKYPVEPTTIQVVKKPRTIVNHSYRDFSRVPPELNDEVTIPINEMTFSQKLHQILSTEEYEAYITWMPHGRAFRVLFPKRFENKVSPKYFGHSRYSSFLRSLNNYGFKHLTKGNDRNCYYHECFLRGLPHLCKYMPKPRNARRLIPDVDNEPNFYKISENFPLQHSNNSVGSSGTVSKATATPECALSAMASVAASAPALATGADQMRNEDYMTKKLRIHQAKIAKDHQESVQSTASNKSVPLKKRNILLSAPTEDKKQNSKLEESIQQAITTSTAAPSVAATAAQQQPTGTGISQETLNAVIVQHRMLQAQNALLQQKLQKNEQNNALLGQLAAAIVQSNTAATNNNQAAGSGIAPATSSLVPALALNATTAFRPTLSPADALLSSFAAQTVGSHNIAPATTPAIPSASFSSTTQQQQGLLDIARLLGGFQ